MLTRLRSGAVWLSIVGVWTTAAAFGNDEAGQGSHSPALSRVVAAWNARQARIKAFHVAWDVRIHLPQGSALPRGRGFVGLKRNFAGTDNQSVDLTLPRSEWWGEGADRLRSDLSQIAFSNAGERKETAQFCLVVDGSRHLRLHVPASVDQPATLAIWRKVPVKYPSNWSSSGDFALMDLDVDLTPLRFALRSGSAAADWSSESSRVVSENVLLDGARCIELQLDRIDHSERCWVDPARDYSVVRWERRQSDCPAMEVTIDLQRGGNGEWVPSRWSGRLVADGAGSAASFEATVTSSTILNQKLPEGTFAPAGPVGTRLYDATVDLPILDTNDDSGMEPPQKARATLAAIADAWIRRQTTAKSFKFSWQREVLPSVGGGTFRKTAHSLAIDGAKLATAASTPGWTPPKPQPAGRPRDDRFGKRGWAVYEWKEVHDGATCRRLSFSERPDDHGFVSISNDSSDRDLGSPGDRELLLVYRPLHPKFGRLDEAELRDPAKFHIVAGTKKIGDVACVVLENERHPGMHDYYWLDPARDYLPLRESRTLNGEDRQRTEFTYRFDPRDGWVPTGWSDQSVGEGGALLGPYTDSVSEATVNRPLPASEFEIEAPRKARVSDYRNDRRFARERAAVAAQEAKMAATLKSREAKLKAHIKPKPKPVYDPFADAAADVEAAMKTARESNRRVLIEFGANWCPGCRDLAVVLKENADVRRALKQGFVLVLVDVDFDTGKKIQEKYVPKRQRNSIPHLAVLDPDGHVLKNDNTTGFEDGDDYDIGKVKSFLAEWSPGK
jgi:thiol-disulfide isomerase/thioredoxin